MVEWLKDILNEEVYRDQCIQIAFINSAKMYEEEQANTGTCG